MAMRTALAEQGFNQEFAANTLMGAMRATVVRALPNRKGKPVLRRFPDHRVRLQGLDRAWDVFGMNKPSEAELIGWEPVEASRLNRRNLSESQKKRLAELEKFSPRMAMRA